MRSACTVLSASSACARCAGRGGEDSDRVPERQPWQICSWPVHKPPAANLAAGDCSGEKIAAERFA
jgi:hypothetical protein